MSKVQTRRTISVNGHAHRAFRAACELANIPMSCATEQVIGLVLDGKVTLRSYEERDWQRDADRIEEQVRRAGR